MNLIIINLSCCINKLCCGDLTHYNYYSNDINLWFLLQYMYLTWKYRKLLAIYCNLKYCLLMFVYCIFIYLLYIHLWIMFWSCFQSALRTVNTVEILPFSLIRWPVGQGSRYSSGVRVVMCLIWGFVLKPRHENFPGLATRRNSTQGIHAGAIKQKAT